MQKPDTYRATSTEFINYLESTLIPDLRESGLGYTATDFEQAIYWIQNPKARPRPHGVKDEKRDQIIPRLRVRGSTYDAVRSTAVAQYRSIGDQIAMILDDWTTGNAT